MFGESPGKVEVQLSKMNFKPGEVIEGTLAITLKKTIKAKGVKIKLEGLKRSSSISMSRGRHHSNMQKVLEIEQELDGEKEYHETGLPMVYPFKIQIPSDLLKKQEFGKGAFGKLMGAAQMLSSATSNIKWTLTGRLDVPMGFDVSKQIQINISE